MYILLMLLAFGLSLEASAAGYGFDVVTPPTVYANELTQTGVTGQSGTWMRVRGVVDGLRVKPDDARTVEGDRAGLLALRARGIKAVVMLRWDPKSWAGGPRAGGGHRMPLDLREAFERGRWLGATYGDLVDGWEIDNEPDIDFGPDNPETYAAFLKAIYLGLHEGARSWELRAWSLELGTGWRVSGVDLWFMIVAHSSQLIALSSKLTAHSSPLRWSLWRHRRCHRGRILSGSGPMGWPATPMALTFIITATPRTFLEFTASSRLQLPSWELRGRILQVVGSKVVRCFSPHR